MIIQVTETLTENRTYYVRTSGATNPGNDSNNGLSDTAAGAFLTVQHAIDVAASLHLSIYDVTIKIADATITEAITLKSPSGSGKLILEGNTTTPSNVVFSTNTHGMFAKNQSGVFLLRGFKITNSAGHSVYALNSTIQFENIDFGSSGGYHIACVHNSYIDVTGDYTVSGNATHHILVGADAVYNCANRTITYQNSPTFSYNFYADRCSYLQCQGMSFVNGNTVTAIRFRADTNAIINTGSSANPNYIPGTQAGETATGGLYF